MEKLYIGKEFFSFELVKASVEKYQNETFTKYYVRDSRTIATAIRLDPNKIMKADLKYSYINYACIAGGRQYQSRSKGIRPNQRTFRDNCPAEIRFSINKKDGCSLQVVSMIEHHNHECKLESFDEDPSKKSRQRKRGIMKRKFASAIVSLENSLTQDDSFSTTTTTTPAKYLRKTRNQSMNQGSENRVQKAMTHPLLPSLLAPTPAPAPVQPTPTQEGQMLAAPAQESVTKQIPVVKPTPRLFVVTGHQRHVMSSLAHLWKRGQLCDAAISNGSSTIKMHKLVLCALCPKLLSLSDSDLKCQRFLRVNFPKEITTEALEAFADYLYNGILDLDLGILKQLKIIAERMDMKEFEQLCSRYFPKGKHQTASATASSADSVTNVPFIKKTPISSMNSSFDSLHSTISTSMQSDPSVNNPGIDIKQDNPEDKMVQVKTETTAVFSQDSEVAASLAPNIASINTVASAITPSIKTELVGPEDDKYGHWCDSSNVQAFTSTTPSFLSSSSVAEAAASTSIATVPSSSSTEFVIRSSESTNTNSIRLKAPHSYEAPLLSDSPPVSSFIETVCSQSSPTIEESSKPFIQSSNSLLSVDSSKRNNAVYPVRLMTARGDNLPLVMLTEDSSCAKTVNTSEKT